MLPRVARALLVQGLLLAAAPALAGPECTCRAAGQAFQLGQSTCLRGERLAVCVMEQNVTSWRLTDTGCSPVSMQTGDPHRLAGHNGLRRF
jgi:hypothetical protein